MAADTNPLEKLTLMFHLAISILLIGSYVFLLARGIDSETMKFAVVGVVGYWFGVTAKTGISKTSTKNKP